MLFKNKKQGFSLLELILVLGVGTMVAFMKFQEMRNEQENIIARSVGQQIKQIGEAVNGYINIRYDKLSTLTNGAGNGTDPGPRTCTVSVCEITYQTLVNEGLLPSTYTGINANRSSYKILLKRDGSAPNYIINGIITTSNAWTEGSYIRYDLLGKAMQEAGVDSGMTKSNTTANGYGGQWTETSTNFNNITSSGQLAYRVGYNSALYSVYLRRDGTLPMTGNLNMGGNDINNAKNITASGTGNFGGDVNSGGNVTATGQVIAHNGYGDSIRIGGDAAGNDYEIYLDAANKPLSLYSLSSGGSPSTTNKSSTLLKVAGAISSGDINSVGDINAGNWLSAKNMAGDRMIIGGDATGDYDVVFEPTRSGINTVGFFSAGSSTPFDFSFRGNVNALNARGTALGASMNGTTGEIFASGNISSNQKVYGQYIVPTTPSTLGQTCSPNGLISRNAEGALLSCINGTFVKQKFTFTTYNVVFPARPTSGQGDEWQTQNLGSHLFCFLSGIQVAGSSNTTAKHVVVSPGAIAANGSGYIWTLSQRVTYWTAGFDTWAYATCAD